MIHGQLLPMGWCSPAHLVSGRPCSQLRRLIRSCGPGATRLSVGKIRDQGGEIDLAAGTVRAFPKHGVAVAPVGQEAVDGDPIRRARVDRDTVDGDGRWIDP